MQNEHLGKRQVDSPNPRAAFLLVQHGKGYGVSVVVQAQAAALAQAGWDVDIFCLKAEEVHPLPRVRVVEVSANLAGLKSRLEWGGFRVVVAHTWPFYGLLPQVRGVFRIAWEHGIPPGHLFPGEEAFRSSFSEGNLEKVYPNVERVVAISGYIRREIGWDRAIVVYNGSDHLWKHRDPDRESDHATDSVIRILMVSRLWKSERTYKGVDDLIELSKSLPQGYQVLLAGRGGEQDAKFLRDRGLQVALNPSDTELCGLYEAADLVVSLSRWEGFNLPLVEAGFFGKPAYALNLCAHPEVTPFVFDHFAAMRDKILSMDREGLRREGTAMNEHVQRFSWEAHGRRVLELFQDAPIGRRNSRFDRFCCLLIESGWRIHLGARGFAKIVRDKILRRS